MTRNRKVALASLAAGALVIGLGAAGAVAANSILSPQQESKAIINDAASQLGVQPSALSKALKDAMKNRIDAAVAAGQLTKEQAAEMKARIDSEAFPLLGPGPMHGFEHGPGGHAAGLAAAASYLGLSESQLRSELAGTTLADLAKKQGKSVDGLVAAMVNAAEQQLDKAVADGKLTKEQATAIKADLKQHIEQLVNGRPDEHGFDRPHPFGFHPDGPRGPPDFGGPHA